jgi:hypothetical protein
VEEDQIIIYTEPNCTSSSSSDLLPDIPLDLLPSASSSSTPDTQNQEYSSSTKKTPRVRTTLKPERSTKAPASELKNDTTPIVPTLPTTEAQLDAKPSGNAKTVNSSSLMQSRRRKRRGANDEKLSVVGGESLILDRKGGFGSEQELHDGKNSSSLKSDASQSTVPLTVSVYFFLNDKNGNYDRELTMAFLAFWNETSAKGNGSSGSMLEGIFYQKVRN